MVELSKAHNIIPIICSVLPADKFSWNPDIIPTQKVIELNAILENYARKNNEYISGLLQCYAQW